MVLGIEANGLAGIKYRIPPKSIVDPVDVSNEAEVRVKRKTEVAKDKKAKAQKCMLAEWYSPRRFAIESIWDWGDMYTNHCDCMSFVVISMPIERSFGVHQTRFYRSRPAFAYKARPLN